MSLANAVLSSIQTQIERFLKLYRILYRDFLYADFIHKNDVKLMIEQLNTRITTVEANCNAQVAAAIAGANANIAAHIHMVPQSPSGTLPSAPPIFSPVPPSTPSAVPPVPWTEVQHTARLQALIAVGPALAPFADSYDAQALAENVTVRSNIGV